MSTPTADVAQMNLNEFTPFDLFDTVEDAKPSSGTSYAPPVEGRYTGRVLSILDDGTNKFSDTSDFDRTQEGYLKVRLREIELLDPAANGYKVRFTNLSSKKYAKRASSQVYDYLRAVGIATLAKSEEELKSLVKSSAGRPFTFQLVWESYNKDTQETVSGMANMSKDEQGNPLPWVKDEFDSTKRWFANGKVRYYVSAVN